MLDIWFGLDASGFNQATTFHPVFGPVVMVTYACLSNTLILTVLVAILSKTFADISQDGQSPPSFISPSWVADCSLLSLFLLRAASAEAMFRKAVSTIEGVKSDAVFSYQAPFNLIAVCVMVSVLPPTPPTHSCSLAREAIEADSLNLFFFLQLPLKLILSPRYFHKVNVLMIRMSAFPILICISCVPSPNPCDLSKRREVY